MGIPSQDYLQLESVFRSAGVQQIDLPPLQKDMDVEPSVKTLTFLNTRLILVSDGKHFRSNPVIIIIAVGRKSALSAAEGVSAHVLSVSPTPSLTARPVVRRRHVPRKIQNTPWVMPEMCGFFWCLCWLPWMLAKSERSLENSARHQHILIMKGILRWNDERLIS